MKLHFEPNLDYQFQAIEAVCDLFHGQETRRTEFTVTRDTVSGQRSSATAPLPTMWPRPTSPTSWGSTASKPFAAYKGACHATL